MQEDILIKISVKIKESRIAKKITVQQLADQSNVSKGLISQIENNRTVPSLPVLMNIIQALQVDLKDFFRDLSDGNQAQQVFVIKAKDYQPFQKETSRGFQYKRIFTHQLTGGPVDFILLTLKKGAIRNKIVHTDAYEFKYILKGKLSYLIDGREYILEEGDSLFFDGRLGHKPANIGPSDAIMLVMYYFTTNRD